MLFVTNDANCSSYTHHIKELFCSPKEKYLTLPLNSTLMTVIIYTGNKVKSSRGKKRLQLNFSLLVSKQYPWKSIAFSWHYRWKHPRILYLCSRIEDRWTSLRIQYFPMVLIHWEKECKTASKTSFRGLKNNFSTD